MKKSGKIMNNKQLTIVALKAVAIYLLIQVLISLSNTAGMLITLNTWFEWAEWAERAVIFVWISGISVVAISLGLAYFVWRLANSVAKSMIGEETKTIIDIPNEKNIETILLSILGLFLIVYGISTFSYAIAHIKTMAASKQFPDGVPADYIVYTVAQALILLMGVSLVVKPSKWGALLQKFRTLGLENK